MFFTRTAETVTSWIFHCLKSVIFKMTVCANSWRILHLKTISECYTIHTDSKLYLIIGGFLQYSYTIFGLSSNSQQWILWLHCIFKNHQLSRYILLQSFARLLPKLLLQCWIAFHWRSVYFKAYNYDIMELGTLNNF